MLRSKIFFSALLLLLQGLTHAYEVITLEVGEARRVARVFTPSRQSEAAPLVLAFHGRGDREGNFARAVRLHKNWREAIVVYPRGEKHTRERGFRGWLGGPSEDSNDDLVFVDALLTELASRYEIDSCRVYAAGFSNGGRFVFRLMSEMPQHFAAFVAIGAVWPGGFVAETPPAPVLYLFGQYEPREYTEAWRETVKSLAALNRASGEKLPWTTGLQALPAREEGALTVYGLYEAGHQWPRNLNDEMVRFLRDQSRCP